MTPTEAKALREVWQALVAWADTEHDDEVADMLLGDVVEQQRETLDPLVRRLPAERQRQESIAHQLRSYVPAHQATCVASMDEHGLPVVTEESCRCDANAMWARQALGMYPWGEEG